MHLISSLSKPTCYNAYHPHNTMFSSRIGRNSQSSFNPYRLAEINEVMEGHRITLVREHTSDIDDFTSASWISAAICGWLLASDTSS